MRKYLISAALVAATFSAKAQMSLEKVVYVGKTSIQNLKIDFKYTRFSAFAETIEIRDTTYSIDWRNLDITIDGNVYPLTHAVCDILKNEVIVEFEGRKLTLKYSADTKRCIGYELK